MSAAGCGSNASSSQIAAPAPAAPADAPAPPKKLTLTSPTNTKFVAGAQLLLVFGVLVPLAFVLSNSKGLVGMWMAAVAYAIAAAAVMSYKFRGGTWKSIKL